MQQKQTTEEFKGVSKTEKINIAFAIDKGNKIEVSETQSFGTKDKLLLKINGRLIGRFFFNMRGYNQDFYLFNAEGVQYGFGGDRSKAEQITNFKKALKEGYTFCKLFD